MKVSEILAEPENPRASAAVAPAPSSKENKRYRDYVIDTQSAGEKPLEFKEWYILRQQGKI